MTIKAELQKQFDEWVDQGKQLKEQIDALPDDKPVPVGRWKPEIGEEYWLMDSTCGEEYSSIWEGCRVDRSRYAHANVYRTKEEAQKALDQQLATVRVLDRIAELNAEQGWKCDWSGYRQDKWIITAREDTKDLDCKKTELRKSSATSFYGSLQTIETVIKEMESDCLLMLGVEG